MKNKIKCNKISDVIVIGGGPSAITTSIYLARRNLCVLMVYETLGGQASTTADIENYAGYKFITGEEFTNKLKKHLDEYDISEVNDKIVGVEKKEDLFVVKTKDEEYSSKAVIIASGARQRKLGIPGEKKFLNKGVAYCATCDAPLFRGKEVAIIGGGNSALEAAIQLQGYAKKLYLVLRKHEVNGEQILIDKVKSFENLELVHCTKIKEINGDKFVEKIIVEQEGKMKELSVQGVFVEIGYLPNSEFVTVEKNDYNEIIINSKNETSEVGIFAAGDVTNVPGKQIIIAAGEGAKVALSVAEYLSRLK